MNKASMIPAGLKEFNKHVAACAELLKPSPRMVKLQINNSGAWRDVVHFDIDAQDAEAIQVAAVNLVVLADPAGRSSLRIATADALQTALVRWDAKKGWVDA